MYDLLCLVLNTTGVCMTYCVLPYLVCFIAVFLYLLVLRHAFCNTFVFKIKTLENVSYHEYISISKLMSLGLSHLINSEIYCQGFQLILG